MSEDAESKSQAGRWIIAVVVALVLYVLSEGPVIALAMKYELSGPACEMLKAFYKPLDWGCERLALDEEMGRYCSWWRNLILIPHDTF